MLDAAFSRNLKTIVLTFMLTTLVGCNATGPKYNELESTELAGNAELIMLRKGKVVASGSVFCVKVNGQSIGVLRNGGFLRTTIQPGKNTISVPFSEELVLDVEARPNEKSFVEFHVGLSNLYAIPVGSVAMVSSSWNMALTETEENYSLQELVKLRESKYSTTCKK